MFSSKRDNGLCARPYFSYFDTGGTEHTPFIFPQRDPAMYETFFMTYNVPELVRGPVRIDARRLSRVINDRKGTLNARLDPLLSAASAHDARK